MRDTDLIALDGLPSAAASQLATYVRLAAGAHAPNTERAIRADMRAFLAWCRVHGSASLPAAPETVAAFIRERARAKALGTVVRYTRSIAKIHAAAGLANPCESDAVALALRAIRRANHRDQRQARGLTWDILSRLLDALGTSAEPIEQRDLAMVALAYNTLARRGELLTVRVDDIDARGARIRLRRHKTSGQGASAFWYPLRPETLGLLKTWLATAAIGEGYVFRGVDRHGNIGLPLIAGRADAGYVVAAAIQRLIARHNYDAPADRQIESSGFSGHSPRIGASQDLMAAGFGMPEIMQAGAWKDPRTVARYTERIDSARGAMARLAERQRRGGAGDDERDPAG
jgi:integrase